MRVIRFFFFILKNIRKKIKNVFLCILIFLSLSSLRLCNFYSCLLKRYNYGRYFNLQMSERKEFISQEKAKRKSEKLSNSEIQFCRYIDVIKSQLLLIFFKRKFAKVAIQIFINICTRIFLLISMFNTGMFTSHVYLLVHNTCRGTRRKNDNAYAERKLMTFISLCAFSEQATRARAVTC